MGLGGFEPPTSPTPRVNHTKLDHSPKIVLKSFNVAFSDLNDFVWLLRVYLKTLMVLLRVFPENIKESLVRSCCVFIFDKESCEFIEVDQCYSLPSMIPNTLAYISVER